MLHASSNDTKLLLIASISAFCEVVRICGNSDDLLSALAKTGFLEQKFEHTSDGKEVYPAILAERSEILWKRQEKIEATQTLRGLAENNTTTFSFNLVPKEIIFAKLVCPLTQVLA
jgi:hypothetical protein